MVCPLYTTLMLSPSPTGCLSSSEEWGLLRVGRGGELGSLERVGEKMAYISKMSLLQQGLLCQIYNSYGCLDILRGSALGHTRSLLSAHLRFLYLQSNLRYQLPHTHSQWISPPLLLHLLFMTAKKLSQ